MNIIRIQMMWSRRFYTLIINNDKKRKIINNINNLSLDKFFINIFNFSVCLMLITKIFMCSSEMVKNNLLDERNL